MRRARLPVLVALMAGLGCAAAQLYEGPARAASEVATFSSSLGDTEASFIAIGGTTIHGDAATVLPGRHRVLIRFSYSDSESYELDLFCSAPVRVEAGRTYSTDIALEALGTNPRAIREGYGRAIRVHVRVADVESGKRVGVCDCRSEDPYACE